MDDNAREREQLKRRLLMADQTTRLLKPLRDFITTRRKNGWSDEKIAGLLEHAARCVRRGKDFDFLDRDGALALADAKLPRGDIANVIREVDGRLGPTRPNEQLRKAISRGKAKLSIPTTSPRAGGRLRTRKDS